MTAIGKLLAFLNLIVGMGIVTWSVAVYTQRPGWFNPPPDFVEKGQSPLTFESLKVEIEGLGRTAVAASAAWGDAHKELEEREATRLDRKAKLAERLGWARKGNPGAKGAPGFYELEEDEKTKLFKLDALGPTVKGPDGQPLRGADTLLADFNRDSKEVVRLLDDTLKLRQEAAQLGTLVVAVEGRLLKQNEIRENLQTELLFLAAGEVNVYEQRETVLRRKKQLVGRLAVFGVK